MGRPRSSRQGREPGSPSSPVDLQVPLLPQARPACQREGRATRDTFTNQMCGLHFLRLALLGLTQQGPEDLEYLRLLCYKTPTSSS